MGGWGVLRHLIPRGEWGSFKVETDCSPCLAVGNFCLAVKDFFDSIGEVVQNRARNLRNVIPSAVEVALAYFFLIKRKGDRVVLG
ncbi:MAG: hypothetical protein D3923_19590 [Candidatus Electrothrix sp. AR3]|nr:hypothetical protein [Candidatus Electrothrix sp. AR3]